MAKIIALIILAFEQDTVPAKTVKADLTLEGANSYTVTVIRADGFEEKGRITADSDEPGTMWLVQKLKQLVDEFDPNTTAIRIISDPSNVLQKISYRCPNVQCHAKLFESWGPATGIRIVCRKCKTLGIPQSY